MIEITDKRECCGCSSCVEKCPKHCIAFNEDNEGFLYPVVDKSVCIDCGICEKVCPMLHPADAITPQAVYAAKNPNEYERLKSSSGGIFIALARAVISKGGVVFGAVFDEKWEVHHAYTENIEGVRPMMGSKYLQSRIENCYIEAERFLKQGREVLFSGTPCQISGLRRFLRREYVNLLAVDFICHGVPSPGVWRKYLQEMVVEDSARRAAAGKNTVLPFLKSLSSIEGIEFRNKRLGWKKYSFVVREKSGSKARQNSVLLSDKHYENTFMKGFLADVYLRPSCYNCKSKGGSSGSDLTIADFWGIHLVMPDFDDDKGMGLVIVNSDKGKEYYDALGMDSRSSSIDIVFKYNPSYRKFATPHPRRAEFFANINRPLTENVERILRKPLKDRLKGKVKRMIKKVVPETVIKKLKCE